jgi:hypothetical protein
VKEYRLKPEAISQYVKRTDSKAMTGTVIAFVAGYLILLFVYKDDLGNFMRSSFGFPVLLVLLMYVVMWYNNKKLALYCAENLRIYLDEHSIQRVINLDNDRRLNWLHKVGYNQAKKTSYAFDSAVNLSELTKVDRKQQDMILYTKTSNRVNGKDLVAIPAELEGFAEIEELIKSRIKR